MAAQNGHLEVVQLLLKSGADVNKADEVAWMWAKQTRALPDVGVLACSSCPP